MSLMLEAGAGAKAQESQRRSLLKSGSRYVRPDVVVVTVGGWRVVVE